MSFQGSLGLQEAVYGALIGDEGVMDAVSGAVFDAEPAGEIPSIYVSLGEETVRTRADVTGFGSLHEFVVSVVTRAPGFATAKAVAGSVSRTLVDADLDLSVGDLVSLRFHRARSLRIDNGLRRRVDLTFRARICGA